jgi:hypothetical protein
VLRRWPSSLIMFLLVQMNHMPMIIRTFFAL